MIFFIRTLILYALVVIVMRLMGKRQIGQLQPFELAITIMISELAAVSVQNTEFPLINGIIPILTLLFAQLVVSIATLKSNAIEKIICGEPSMLIENGIINEKNLRSELYTITDLLEQLRIKNIPNINDIEFALLETNGDLSVVPKTPKRTVNISDLNIASIHEGLNMPIIIDGKIMSKNLKLINKDTSDIYEILRQKNIDSPKKVLFASLNDSGEIFLQKKSS